MIANKEELLDLIAAKYDIYEVMDLLGWDDNDIIRKLAPHILANIELFDDLDLD